MVAKLTCYISRHILPFNHRAFPHRWQENARGKALWLKSVSVAAPRADRFGRSARSRDMHRRSRLAASRVSHAIAHPHPSQQAQTLLRGHRRAAEYPYRTCQPGWVRPGVLSAHTARLGYGLDWRSEPTTDCGLHANRNSLNMVIWRYGEVAQWQHGLATFRQSGKVALRHCGIPAKRRSGIAAIWSYGVAVLRRYGIAA